jgi:hypothetical protein
MDTRFWGPSGWQLFHLVAFRSEHPDDVLNQMKDVLPCKYCRASTTDFVQEHPLRDDPGKWMYDIHNMVNAKLRKQAVEDPNVVHPGPDPSFEDIRRRYMAMKPTQVPGRDFLMAIAMNYPEEPEPEQMATQRTFLHALAKVYPFKTLRKVFQRYLRDHEVDLGNQKVYLKWMYGLLKELSKEAGVAIRSYKGYVQHVAYYKSGCSKKTYRGKTCRMLAGGGRTKDRDHRKTQRITRVSLL